jgi:RNA polymerase sigma-70 factor (ECF subfamily)
MSSLLHPKVHGSRFINQRPVMSGQVETFIGMDVLEEISRLARERRSALAALARAEGVSPEDAVDCVQEALCTLLGRVERLPTDPGEWHSSLAMMVKNAARNRRRRRFLARPHVPLADDLAAPGEKADETLARADEHVKLRLCVDELCEIQKAVVTLRMLEEQPGEDVARALGISAAHVAVLLHRAKNSLRACMTTRS